MAVSNESVKCGHAHNSAAQVHQNTNYRRSSQRLVSVSGEVPQLYPTAPACYSPGGSSGAIRSNNIKLLAIMTGHITA